MVITEKDFMYVEGVPSAGSEEEEVKSTPEATPTDEVKTDKEKTVADVQTEEIEKIASEEGATTEETPVATTEEVIKEEPVDETVTEETVETPSENVSGDELQKMLDALDEGNKDTEVTTEEIKKTAEEVKVSLGEKDKESTKKLDELLQNVAELTAQDQKNKKTIEILRGEYDKMLTDKLSLEYGTANDSKIASMVNDDPNIKGILSAKISSEKSGDNTQLISAYKTALEGLTGQSFDEIVNDKKNKEIDALAAGGEDAGLDMPEDKEGSLYVG